MHDNQWLAQQFDGDRERLRGVAYRMLGSLSEADDAVQEAWLRVARADASSVENFSGWLTTIVSRICLDMLRTRTSRREEPLAAATPVRAPAGDPESEAVLADMVGLAMLVVLDTLQPAERVAFVLHDMFDLPFDSIATILGKSPDATRQLASRARRRVRGGETVGASDVARQSKLVTAFLDASREGNFEALLAALDPNVVFRADAFAVAKGGSPREMFGADAVAKEFVGRAKLARAALVDGRVGVLVAPLGKPLLAFHLTFAGDKIASIDVVMEPENVRRLQFAAAL